MSYDITAVERNFAMKCRSENKDLGQILEETPEIVPEFTQESRKTIIKFLTTEEPYVIESEQGPEIVFKHKEAESVQVTLRRNTLDFSAGFSEKWTILDTTALVTIEPGAEIMRFDFQDVEWG
ncbi:hypothetical protein [Cellulophaga baltica]|uniref:hypothetical protein n=1 Tax=Cellulophaga baltica TaxID=76594 RepID=UPI0003F980E4|nr:hypothetical protein [Cellulophaga baltica]AIY15035.1 hypothetical protein M667_18735 [Cellulophaga baltica NN016038]